MRKMLLLALGMLSLYLQVAAQSRTISGKITDNTGSPVPNASITVKGTSIGTTSGADGAFSLSVPTTARQLEVSSVGFAVQTFDLTRSNVLNISLSNTASEIAEVVVTGYSRENKRNFTGAASQLSGKVVETVPVGSFEQALQGRAPGLLINSGSGQPGTSANIMIRGVHSITGAFAQPLIVMDGVPLPAADLQTINPNDFESITVLKDGSAAALYGARGGLGVIVITTKKGKAGTSNFNYRTQFGITNPPRWNRFDMMNTKEILQYEERLGLGGYLGTTQVPGWQWSPLNPSYATASPTERALRDHLLDSLSQIDTDYTDILFRNGFSQLHEISLSGGSEKTRFFLSASMFDQEGTDLRSDLRRYTTRFNIDHTTGKLSVQFNTLAGYSITNFSEGEFLGNSARNSFQMAWRSKPYENPYKPDGTLNFGANTTMALKQIANVLEGIENSVWRQNQIKVNTGLTLAYKILPSLTVKNTLGLDVSDDRFQHWIKAGSFYGSTSLNGGNGIDQEASRITAQIINTTGAMYSQRFNVHEVEAGAFFEVVRGYQRSMGFTLYNLDPRLNETGQGAGTLPTATNQQFAQSAKTGYGIRSYFATAKYTYDSKYTLTANVRRDGTSRIVNTDNKEITTWSAGISWNAMEETFMKNQNVLSDWRMRFSYGSVPNIGSISTNSYSIAGGLANVTNYLGQQIPSYGTGANYGSATGQSPLTPGNPYLKIETIQKFNLGTDFAFWRNRARFTVDAYYDKTVDLFVNLGLPVTAGFGTPFTIPTNAGIMTNKGLEFTASVDVVKSKDILLTLGMNHAINVNKIEDLGSVNEIPQGTFIIRKGLPYGSHYSTHYLGADPATGRPMFEREDGTTTLDPGQAFLFAKFGTFLPKHMGGFSADFKWKNFTISALFSYQFDVMRSNNIENWVVRGIVGYHASVNASRRLLTEQWEKPGDQKFYQSPGYDRGFSSSDIQDAKFLRFRNLVVSYNIPAFSVGGLKLIKSARVYVQGQNLAIWSPWRGPDPEDNNNISLNEFPNSRMFVGGIDINF